MISYRNDFGLWWPDWDQKADKNHAYILKHLPTMDFAIEQCRERRFCVQAGGHAGIWPRTLSAKFETVYTFEPDPDLFECLRRNALAGNVKMQQTALSNANQIGFLNRSISSGANYIDDRPGAMEIDLMTLDAVFLPACDAIFLDVEGHELQALEGAKRTIQVHRPVIQVEELDDGEKVSLFLHRLGYRPHPEKQGKDRVYLPC